MLRAALASGLLLAFSTGCQSTDSADGKGQDENTTLVVQEEKEWRDPPVGSHMKRRHRRGAAQAESITRPTSGGKITEETDTLVMPVSAGQIMGSVPGG